MGIATAIGGIMRVERTKNSRSSFIGTLKRENAYAAVTPRSTESAVEPNAMMSELMKRGWKFDGATSTMLFWRASRSQTPVGAGSLAMYSSVWRERALNKLHTPSAEGSNTHLGGYAIESGPDFSAVMKIHARGIIVSKA